MWRTTLSRKEASPVTATIIEANPYISLHYPLCLSSKPIHNLCRPDKQSEGIYSCSNFPQDAVLLLTYYLLLLFYFSFEICLVFPIKIVHVRTLPDFKSICFGDLFMIWEGNLGAIQGPARPNTEHIQVQFHFSSHAYKISLWLVAHRDVISHIGWC